MLSPSSMRRRHKVPNRSTRITRTMIKRATSFMSLVWIIVATGGFMLFYSRYPETPLVQSNTSFRMIKGRLRGTVSHSWVTQDAQPFDQDHVTSSAKHLIVVAGHSVVVAGNLQDAGTDESVWWLLDYQKGQGMPQAIIGHIQAGIQEANQDPEALLVFSGGQTRSLTGPISEGSSYFMVADAMKLWPKGSTVRARTISEEFATDSFENLLFSICRFYEVTGKYPEKITMVSFTFKQRRFETLHAPALGYSSSHFKFVGFDPPISTGFNLETSKAGEEQNAAKPFESDPYGCHSQVLQEKRNSRNPFHRTSPYPLTCPDMSGILQHCGPEFFPKDSLPWANLV